MKKLIITEKSSVMKDFIRILEPSAKAICYEKPYVYYYEGKNYIFACANGHLFEVKSPDEINADYKKWTSDIMHFPDTLPLKPIKRAKGSFQCMKDILKKQGKDIDEVIVITDPDREGQLIWALIERNLTIKQPISRVWIKEWPDAALKRAFHSRVPNSHYKNLEDAGLGRLQADYIIGMNGTRINTVCFGGYKNVINEGRVQSPTRFLVADLENRIQNFKPEDYSVIVLKTESEDTTPLELRSDTLHPDVAKKLNPILKGQSYTMQVEKQTTKKGCPMLYKTNKILQDASNKLGFSTEKTTEILQKLYQDYALTTYPRTEIEQISLEASKNVGKILKSLDGIGLVDDIINEIKENNYTFQKHLVNTKGGEMPHEAITPTFEGNPASVLHKLSSDERQVYELIVKRFLQGFYPPAVIDETKVSTSIKFEDKDYAFKNSGKVIVTPSWMKISGIPSDSVLPQVLNGKDYMYINTKVENKKTQAPTRYTEAKLLDAMEHVSRFVDDKESQQILKQTKGIGTGATRNDTLERLYKSGFLYKKGKTIYPTEKCMDWYNNTPESPLKSPLMTAELETSLSAVEHGEKTLEEFMSEVYEQVETLHNIAHTAPKKTISSNTSKVPAKPQSSDLGVCPFCGKPMRENEKSYYCTGYKDGCSFSIWKIIAEKKISKTTAKSLITKGYTGKLKGFISNKGKPFEAKLIVDSTTRKIKFK